MILGVQGAQDAQALLFPMKPETLAVVVGIVGLLAELVNLYLLARIRVSQLESEQRIMAEVDDKYVRKDSAILVDRPHGAIC